MFGKRNFFFFFFLHIIVSNILVLNLLAHPDNYSQRGNNSVSLLLQEEF